MMWLFANEHSRVDSLNEVYQFYQDWQTKYRGTDAPMPISANVEDTKTWDIIESENHHAMILAAVWHFTKFLQDSPDYKNREFEDGLTAEEHHAAWTKYYKEYIRQRAKKGLFVEMADDSYNQYTIKGLYNLYDFAEDELLQKVSR